jgi:hypothetical protein
VVTHEVKKMDMSRKITTEVMCLWAMIILHLQVKLLGKYMDRPHSLFYPPL